MEGTRERNAGEPWWGGVLALAAGTLGPVWLWARRVGYEDVARPLTAEDRAELAPYFDGTVLDAVRVAVVKRIENPVAFEVWRAMGRSVPVDLTGVWGMCFGDVVAVTRGAMETRGLSTLFHELVHTVQMRRVGMGRFCRGYVGEFVRFGYAGIGFEEEAFELQGRFERGEVFGVE